jgi:predicted nucleic acid-binding protein
VRRVRVLLDANVLVDAQVRDLFLRLAEADLIDVRWSDQIFDETRRALVTRLGLERAASDRLLEIMQRAFPHAAVTGHEHLVENLDLPDPDDRHVLAAAIHSECDLLVTDNTRDFSDKSVEDADLLVITVDDALTLLADRHRDKLTAVVSAQIAALRRPPSTVEAFIDRLATRAPNAAMTIGSSLGIAKYQRILVDARDAHDDYGPQGAVRRLLDAIGEERHEDVVALVDPQPDAARLTATEQPTPSELHPARRAARCLHDRRLGLPDSAAPRTWRRAGQAGPRRQ